MKIFKFLKLSGSQKALFIEAVLCLFLSRLAVLVLPFRFYASRLGRHMEESDSNHVPDQLLIVKETKKIVSMASRNLPWECKCLVQAMAARMMLKRRGIITTIYFGVAKDKDKGLKAHAWLRSGEVYVSGGKGREEFVVVAFFGEKKGLP